MNQVHVLRDVDVLSAAYARPRPGAAHFVPGTDLSLAVAVAVGPTLEEQLAASYRDGVHAGRSAEARKAALERAAADREELERSLALATQEGYAQGLAKADAEATQAAEGIRREMDQRVETLGAIASSISAQAGAAMESAEDEMVALCHQVVCLILGDLVATPEGVRALVQQALKHLAGRPVAVHLHPDDLGALGPAASSAQDPVRWFADTSVAMGGAVLRSSDGSLDARLETQLQALHERLMTVRAAQRARRSAAA